MPDLNSLSITNTMFKHKDVHKCTWHQDTLELSSMTDFQLDHVAREYAGQTWRIYTYFKGVLGLPGRGLGLFSRATFDRKVISYIPSNHAPPNFATTVYMSIEVSQ